MIVVLHVALDCSQSTVIVYVLILCTGADVTVDNIERSVISQTSCAPIRDAARGCVHAKLRTSVYVPSGFL